MQCIGSNITKSMLQYHRHHNIDNSILSVALLLPQKNPNQKRIYTQSLCTSISGMHLAIFAVHLGAAGSGVTPAEVSTMVRIVTGTSNAGRPANDSRHVTVPWTHGLQSLDKQTASFPIRLANCKARSHHMHRTTG